MVKPISSNFIKSIENQIINFAAKRRNVVQDNARIHHTKLLKEYTKEKHINMRYNPAYSPEFNPIELCFNKVKCEFRKNTHDNLENDIVTAFNSISSENCLSFYKKVQEIMNSYK